MKPCPNCSGKLESKYGKEFHIYTCESCGIDITEIALANEYELAFQYYKQKELNNEAV